MGRFNFVACAVLRSGGDTLEPRREAKVEKQVAVRIRNHVHRFR